MRLYEVVPKGFLILCLPNTKFHLWRTSNKTFLLSLSVPPGDGVVDLGLAGWKVQPMSGMKHFQLA